MSDNNFRTRDFYPLIERLGICESPKPDQNGRKERRRITPHSTRHTFISLASAIVIVVEKDQKVE